MLTLNALLLISSVFSRASTTSNEPTYTPFQPPSYPLAVRNPYVSAWLPGSEVADLSSCRPQFWFGNPLNWSVIARVAGTSYNLFGVPDPDAGTQSAALTSASFTATHSTFVLTAGDTKVTLDFFSPVSFENYTRQSFPFSYLTVSASPLNGASPLVQIYSDIDETWTGQNNSTTSTFTTSGNASIFQLRADHNFMYHDSPNQQALWGSSVFAGSSRTAGQLSAGSGVRGQVRNEFHVNGSLTGQTPNFAHGDVVALTYDLGTVTEETSATFAIGHVRIGAVNYLGQAYTPYYRAYFPTNVGAVTHFLNDHAAAVAESQKLDVIINSTGVAVAGQNYSDILALSVRQTMGGIDLTIPNNTLDTGHAAAFIKEISSDGNIQTMDIIVELLPFFYIFNPEYLRLLLNPVLSYLATNKWPHQWVIHDLGHKYPNATGHDDGIAEEQPVEETGNLLILMAAYQAASGNKTFASTYKSLLEGYAVWLSKNGLYPTHQLSTNDGLGPFTNMTQLGVKTAVGLAAYGQLIDDTAWINTSNLFGSIIEETGVGMELSSATGQNYFTLSYGNETWFMMFNLYPAKLLNITCFSDASYNGQSAFYDMVRGPYGVPLDGTVHWGKTDWQMWAAAVASTSTRQQMIDDLHAYASNRKNNIPFPDRYYADGDRAGLVTARNFRARPVLGAHFAIWALEKPWRVRL